MLIRLALLAATLIASVPAKAADLHLVCHLKSLANGTPSTRTIVVNLEDLTVNDDGRVFRNAVASPSPGLEMIVVPQKHGVLWGQRTIATGEAVESFFVDLQHGDYLGDGWVSGPVARGVCVIPEKIS